MAKDKLKDAAVKIGSAVGKIDGTAHKAAHKAAKRCAWQGRAGCTSKQVDALTKQLKKSSKRLQSALK